MKFTPCLRKDRPSKDGYPVRIMIADGDKPARYVSLGFRCSVRDWDEAAGRVKRSRTNYAEYNNIIVTKLLELERSRLKSAGTGAAASSAEIVDEHRGQGSFFYYFQKKIDAERARGSHARADADTSIMNVIKEWRSSWKAAEVKPETILELEDWLMKRGNSESTIIDKIKRIRAVSKRYPSAFQNAAWGSKGYKVKAQRPSAKQIPLDDDDLEKLRAAAILPHRKVQVLARTLWIFALNAGGMRWGDVCVLRWKNVEGDRIRYFTSKSGGVKLIDIPQTDEAREIIAMFPRRGDDDYVFPVLGKKYKDPQAIVRRIRTRNSAFNAALKAIARREKMKNTPRFHASRHTAADMIDDIHAAQMILGHDSATTTAIYKKTLRGNRQDEALLKAMNKKK